MIVAAGAESDTEGVKPYDCARTGIEAGWNVSSASYSSSSHSSSSADVMEVGVAEMLLAISDVAVDVGPALSTKIVGVLDGADDVTAVDVGPAE